MGDVVDLVCLSDEEYEEDTPGPTRAELKRSACAHEAAWFNQIFPIPDEQVMDSSIPQTSIETFQDLIWNKPIDRMVPGYGMNSIQLASIAAEGRKGWLVTSHFDWLSSCLNGQQNHTRFYVLQPTIRASVLQKMMVTKTSSQVKQMIFVLAVGRQDDGIVFLGTDENPGDHWSMAVVDIHSGVVTYCDTLGWPIPVKLLQTIVRYTQYLHLTSVKEITTRLAHQPNADNSEQHVCSGKCTNYPLQTCSDICGIITMVTVAIAAFDKGLFELLLKPQQGNIYLTDPTQYSTYLRHVVLHWIATKHIDITRISLKPGFDPFASPRPAHTIMPQCHDPSDEPSFVGKRKLEEKNVLVETSADSASPAKRKPTETSFGGEIEGLFDGVQKDIATENLIEKVNRICSEHLKKSSDSLYFEYYQDIEFNNGIERHKDEGLSLKSYILDLIESNKSNPIIIYKNQGKEMNHLNKEDFILGIQTPFQKEMMKTYGKQCLCIDMTRKRDVDNYHLYTILTFVEGVVELPVAWLISNRSDRVILNLFFRALRLSVGSLQTEIFIGDMGSSLHKAWCEHFPRPHKRMFCIWDIERVLDNRLEGLITNLQSRSKVKHYLSAIPQITNVKTCEHYVNLVLKLLESHNDFKEYFEEKYVSNSKLEFWAPCYRAIPASKFIPFLHPFSKTLEYLGLYGRDQALKRSDVMLIYLLQLSRCLEYKVHMTSEARLLRAKKQINFEHSKSAQDHDIYTSASGDAWLISASSTTSSFSVMDTGIIDCKCSVRCSTCKFCVHRYLCTCPDFLLSSGGCSHSHSVHMFRKVNAAISNMPLQTSLEPSKSNGTSSGKTLGAELHKDRLGRLGMKHINVLMEQLNEIRETDVLQEFVAKLEGLASPKT